MKAKHITAQLLSELAQVDAALADDDNDGGSVRVLDTADGVSGYWYGRRVGILSTLAMLARLTA
tara:strand:+ start:345 stop:536 length:192 start_codon:yes stop_codon:yes gene_type:complete